MEENFFRLQAIFAERTKKTTSDFSLVVPKFNYALIILSRILLGTSLRSIIFSRLSRKYVNAQLVVQKYSRITERYLFSESCINLGLEYALRD
jgi:hypothetical protein